MANIKLDTQLDPKIIQDFMDKIERNTGIKESSLHKEVRDYIFDSKQGNDSENSRKKWERRKSTGRMWDEDAKRLALFIGQKLEQEITVSDLQYPNIQDRKAKLVELMKCAVKTMDEANDKDSLSRIAEIFGFKQNHCDTVSDDDYADLSDKIEWLHLFGESGELESFAKIFGVSAHELRPAPLASFWLFSSSNLFGNCHSLGKLVSGHAGVLAEIKANWDAISVFCRYPEAIKATVHKEGMRYRLYFKASNTLKFTCLFYACAMTADAGLSSINASTWEQEKLMESLKSFLFDHAYTVVINEQFPPENVRRVYQVRFFDMDDNGKHIELGRRIYNHRLPLHDSLKNFLKKHDGDLPGSNIQKPFIYSPGIGIWQYENYSASKFYEISFGWLGSEGEFHVGPWPEIFRKNFINQLSDIPVLENYEVDSLHEIRMLNEDDEIPPFEPEQQFPASEGVAA